MTPQPPRAASACEACRRRKVKCSGDQPCRSCARHNWECTFGYAGRRRYSEAHVRGLLQRIQEYEEQLNIQTQARLHVPSQSSPLSRPDTASPGLVSVAASASQSVPFTPRSVARNASAVDPSSYRDGETSMNTNLTSGPEFESQVRALLDRDSVERGSSSSRGPPNMRLNDMANLWTSSRLLTSDDTLPIIPSLEESQHLLDRFLFYLGVSQHFFDPRTFSDCMIMLFQDEEKRETQIQTTWFTEYLLVMAMARLMDVESPSRRPPGANLFAEAMRRLPALHQMGEEGIIGVEILTLISTYLQWCDRKHDAYLHIGLALRLAIALGCDKPAIRQSCLPSQAAHRVRLWWTVYMLDRRLSSGLGLAAGADERQLRAELPQRAIGFQSPIPLSINVRIARITDDIISSLYGNASIKQIDLVRKIQKILNELYEIGRSFPTALALDFSQPLHIVTRTGASLYLMLFQAIILCIRPVLLQRVRQEVQRQAGQQPPQPVPTALARLCTTCSEAATKSLDILYNLKRQKTIPRYGFFDLDATFSAAFVLVMMGFMDKGQHVPPSALNQAFEVLQFLADAGNIAADRRLQDITHSCRRVWHHYPRGEHQPRQLDSEQTRIQSTGPNSPLSQPAQRSSTCPAPAVSTFLPTPEYTAVAADRGVCEPKEGTFIDTWMLPDASNVTFDIPGDMNFDLSPEAEGIYSSFYDPALPLTGVDHLDWLEIEKVFDQRE